MSTVYHPRALLLGLALSLTCLSAGCSKPAHGNLAGKVTLDNVPVTGGTVFVVAFNGGEPFSGNINPDGTYRIENAPAGDVLVSVITPQDTAVTVEQAMAQKRSGQHLENGGTPVAPPPPPAPQNTNKVPAKYGDPMTSGLTVKVEGETNYDIILTKKP